MKSFAIKLIDKKIEYDLISELELINMEDFYLSSKDFKNFRNVIIHYKGKEIITFIAQLSEAISNLIQKRYDKIFIDKIISKNYFYILPEEQQTIKQIAYKILVVSSEENLTKEILKNLVFEYLLEHKNLLLEGFINFRIKEYMETIDYIVELAVTSYLNIII